MIQDILPHIYNNAFHNETPEQDSIIFAFSGLNIYVRPEEGGSFHFPTYEEWPVKDAGFTYVFSIDGRKFFQCEAEIDPNMPGYEFKPKSFLRTTVNKHMAFAGITAIHIHDWYSSHRFCGACGHPTVRDAKERMIKCPECGHMEYPKICPAVIVAVTHGDKLLVAQYPRSVGTSYYGLIAGFAEVGESLEQTVHREVMEEVGLKVKNLRFYKSQPWSLTETLLSGFYCELDGDEDITLDRSELGAAFWLRRDEIAQPYDGISLTNEMICRFAGTLPPSFNG